MSLFSEIIFNAEFSGFKIQRTPKFSLYKAMRCVPVAKLTMQDTDFEIYSKAEGAIKITFGWRDGVCTAFDGIITSKDTTGAEISEITAIGKHDFALASTFVTESYNDEEPEVIIRRLASLAGVNAGKIDVPGEPIPHIIFDNVPVWRALSQLRIMLIRNGTAADTLDYRVRDGELIWGDMASGYKHRAAVKENIITHKTRERLIELPLTPNIEPGDMLDIYDPRKGITGERLITSVLHSYEGEETRSWVTYENR
jgi:hypothetical protein